MWLIHGWLDWFRAWLCFIGLHSYVTCQPNEICDKHVQRCQWCMDVSCSEDGKRFESCSDQNPCDWSFVCGLKN